MTRRRERIPKNGKEGEVLMPTSGLQERLDPKKREGGGGDGPTGS